MVDVNNGMLYQTLTTAAVTANLGFMGAAFGLLPKVRRQLKGDNGKPYQARIVFRTFDGSVAVSSIFDHGFMTVRPWKIDNPDVTVFYRDADFMKDLLSARPKRDIFNAMLDGDVVFEGNLSHLARFSFLATEVVKPKQQSHPSIYTPPTPAKTKKQFITPKPMVPHEGVAFLKDPAFADKTLDDWPALKSLWVKHFTTRPDVCSERSRLFTEFFKENGFEQDKQGEPWDPTLRQGRALEYALSNRRLLVQDDDLLLGSTTCKPVGVPIYAEFGGLAIWPELNTVTRRELNPYDIDERNRTILNEFVFPFWIDRNVREYARKQNGNPDCQRLEERWVLYFMWKVHAVSHTIPDFPTLLEKGLVGICKDAEEKINATRDQARKNFHEAVVSATTGVMNYASRLADAAESFAGTLDPEKDAAAIEHFRTMAKRVRHSPANPPRTLAEAINAVWIVWTALHCENMNAGLSIGRLDTWFQPFFEADMKAAKTEEEKEEIIHEAIELMGAFFLKCQDHLPLVPDIGNRLFGGSSSDQVITVGGVDAEGNSAVCDMTYIILKVAEMLGMRDPNLNARHHPQANPKQYLRRLVEVNAITGATPSIHNDEAVIKSLEHQGFATPDARDWSATGCVEPTSCGRHMGHTNCMLLNLVAPMEMVLNNGVHPLLGDEVVGELTGDLRKGEVPETFEAFFKNYKKQLKKMIEYSIQYNNQLGRAHQVLHPTPLLSSLIQGTEESGKDVINGGAKYNSSGAAMVALTDVVDSLMTVKHLIYDKKKVTWQELMEAIDSDFVGHDKLHAQIMHKVPKFGGTDAEPNRLAQNLINFIYDTYNAHENYRGGRYTAGFWSMSNHVAFGVLSGALPSGRKKGKAFTPGITPAASAADNILDPIHAVGSLDPLKMPNNIAFNVKLCPAPNEPSEKFVDHATDLAESYAKIGGMQIQFNMVTSQTLRDAMEHPESYRNLLVRISGYNAYFVELNKDMQVELFERAEFRS